MAEQIEVYQAGTDEPVLISSSDAPVKTSGLITFKSDLVRRATNDESEILDAALNEASSKLRLLYYSITRVEHDSPEFPILRDIFVSLFGIDRADELLAPSIGV